MVPTQQSQAAGEALFQSVFGAGVSDASAYQTGSPKIIGLDGETGYSWDSLPSVFSHSRFQYVTSSPVERYVTTEIRPSFKGRSNVLFMEVKGDDPNHSSLTRNELSFYVDGSGTNHQHYGKYWVYLQDDYTRNLGSNSWHVFWELKESSAPGCSSGTNNWRLGMYIRVSGGKPFWQFQTEQVCPSRNREQLKDIFNVPVPIGEWFQVEYFFKRGTAGRFWFAVNGQTVVDFNGRTQHATNPRPLEFVSPFKNYRDQSHFSGGKTAWQYYDGLEIWTDFPARGGVPATPTGLVVEVN